MFSLLLSIIYVAFSSLGLPDSLLGAGWPVMSAELNVPISYAGIISMLIAACTIISSLLSNRFTHKIGVGLVTSISVFLTALSLTGFSLSSNFLSLCIFAIPYGLGAGGIDAALNNYAAIHFKARHMSWLHCFWGIGASISPYIMGYFLLHNKGWQDGYRAVAIIQIIFSVIMFCSLPLWKKNDYKDDSDNSDFNKPKLVGIKTVLKIKCVPYILVCFFAYCALETTAGLWASTYLNKYRGVSVEIAARFASLFYLGITAGRFINGFIAEKVGDKNLIRTGIIVITVGVIMVMIPVETDLISLAGLIIVGFGCAPVYPSIIHATPINFGVENSQAIVGIQMASAYVGSTFMPPLFGFIATKTSVSLYPFYLMIFVILMIFSSEIVNRNLKK